jgi:hypothetical protein
MKNKDFKWYYSSYSNINWSIKRENKEFTSKEEYDSFLNENRSVINPFTSMEKIAKSFFNVSNIHESIWQNAEVSKDDDIKKYNEELLLAKQEKENKEKEKQLIELKIKELEKILTWFKELWKEEKVNEINTLINSLKKDHNLV